MGKVYISEYANSKPIGVGAAMLQEPAVAEQQLNTANTSTASAAFNAKTCAVRIHTDAIISVKFSDKDATTPTALVTAHRMAANTTEYFAVPASGKVAVIDNT